MTRGSESFDAVLKNTVDEAAAAAGISTAGTLKRAMKEAGLEAYRVSKRGGKRGEGEWYWIKKHTGPDMPRVPEASTLGPVDHLDHLDG